MNTQDPDNLTKEELKVFRRYVRARERRIPITGDSNDADDCLQAMKQHIRMLRHRWPIPLGLERCPDCFEYRGTTKIKYLKTSYRPENPEEDFAIHCKCQGPMCSSCGKNRIRKPGSFYYTLSGQSVYCSGLFTLMRGCDECNRKRNEEREARSRDSF